MNIKPPLVLASVAWGVFFGVIVLVFTDRLAFDWPKSILFVMDFLIAVLASFYAAGAPKKP